MNSDHSIKESDVCFVHQILRLFFIICLGLASITTWAGEPPPNLKPLDIQLPNPAFMGTPPDLQFGPHVEKPSDKPRPPFLAPAGAKNVALHKKVTSSDPSPLNGSLDLVTDGDKEATDDSYVELHRRTQWVQIDLAGEYRIYAIVVWHSHGVPQIYRDVVAEVADDPDFTKNIHVLFNNDYDNTSGMGVGTDKEYLETYEGKLIDAKGVVGRYVRLYSNGSTASNLNRYTEVEVYGLPASK